MCAIFISTILGMWMLRKSFLFRSAAVDSAAARAAVDEGEHWVVRVDNLEEVEYTREKRL